MTTFEAIIKVNPADPPTRRARDIEEGLAYACVLLMDEYELSADEVEGIMERITDALRDTEEGRAS